ncbi:MAG: penicillin-insensitive murein endopeptidase [Myxococcales bacterium]|nr:penicillin-insensitive murein endopeptidase [Myxococcales bacterium]MCB9627895.1 penicillin-insensitive murein endopeptidase [Sandaracinaceae bacterium]
MDRRRAAQRLRTLTLPALCVLSGCVPPTGPSDESYSFGTTSSGMVVHAAALPERGPGFVRARPGEATRAGTRQLVGALSRAAAYVEATLPGGAPVRIGDLSSPHGGRHSRHGSHRAGRDADVIFYATDAAGSPTRGRGWLAYDRFGTAREPDEGGRRGRVFFFDDARNWAFVRALLLDPEARVQWIFVSNGIKARLLRYAAAHEQEREAVYRAREVLHQPSRGNPHADHFHVRVACGLREQQLGCQDWGPVWPWLRHGPLNDPSEAQTPWTDDALVDALMGVPTSAETSDTE